MADLEVLSFAKLKGPMMPATNQAEATRNIFVTGLRNAHAMENQALSIMKPQVERIERYPDVEERLRLHIDETEGQIQRLESILDDLGEDRSALKDTALSLGGAMAAIGHTFAPDEILKNSFANFAFENYEIAAYKSLIALGQDSYAGSVGLLQRNLEEELAMADWLNQNIETVTLRFADLKARGDQPKM